MYISRRISCDLPLRKPHHVKRPVSCTQRLPGLSFSHHGVPNAVDHPHPLAAPPHSRPHVRPCVPFSSVIHFTSGTYENCPPNLEDSKTALLRKCNILNEEAAPAENVGGFLRGQRLRRWYRMRATLRSTRAVLELFLRNAQSKLVVSTGAWTYQLLHAVR